MNIMGEAIKKARKAKGYKQNEFAVKCEISQSHLSRIENGKSNPSIKVLKVFQSHIHVPLSVLMYLAIIKEDLKISLTREEAK